MIKKVFLLICLLSLSAVACNKVPAPQEDNFVSFDNELTSSELTALSASINGSVLSDSELQDNINAVIGYLDGGDAMKGAFPRFVSNITPVGGASGDTKSSEGNIAFIVNFGDDRGYTVLSSDRRTDEIFAVSSSGNLNLETLEQDYNAGKVPEATLYLLSNIDEVMQCQIARYQDKSDALVQSAIAKLALDSPATKALINRIEITQKIGFIEAAPRKEDLPGSSSFSGIGTGSQSNGRTNSYSTSTSTTQSTDWTTVESGTIEPMVKVSWGQGTPFNNATPLVEGQHTLAGCVATAMAQLMSYWEYPSTFNWELLKAYPYMDGDYTPKNVADEVSRLMSAAGKGVNMEYGLTCSGANLENAVNYFKKAGYFNPGNYGTFADSKALNSLNNGHPLLTSGYDTVQHRCIKIWFIKIPLRDRYSGGHCWVIDGALRQRMETTVYVDGKVSSQITRYRTLFHCNFGWNGFYDGYYADDVFHTNTGPDDTKCIAVTQEGEEKKYQYKLSAVYDIEAY